VIAEDITELSVELVALLKKLSNQKNSIRDCVGERHDWVKAGCPILRKKSNENNPSSTTEPVEDK